MEKMLLLSIAFCTMILACTKESGLTDASIIGIDSRKCASPYCGGWFIETGPDTLRFLAIPERNDLDAGFEDHLPLPVRIKWEKYQDPRFNVPDLIVVTELWKR